MRAQNSTRLSDNPAFWVVLFLLLRLFTLGFPNLLVEEAYYWQYAAHLAPGYIDHPPAVAVLIHLGTAIFGHNEFGVRIGALVCWGIGAGFIFKLARDIFDRPAALGALVLFAALPFFFGATWMMTPDAPLVACWSGAVYFFYRALVEDKPTAWWGVGLFMGLGMLSKYTIALVALSAAVFMLIDRGARRQFLSPRPYIAALLGLLLFSPVLSWNVSNDWASFAFQGSRRLEEKSEFYLHRALLDILIVLTPVGAAAVWAGFKRAAVRSMPWKIDRARLFCLIMALTPVFIFLAFSLTRETRINWTGPAFLAALPLLGLSLSQSELFPRWINRGWRITLPLLFAAYAGALVYAGPVIPGIPYAKKLDKFVAWDDLAAKLNTVAQEVKAFSGETPLLVGMDKHYVASELAFYTKKLAVSQPGALPLVVGGRSLFGQPSLMYRFWSPPEIALGRTLILVSRTKADLEFPEIEARTALQGPILEMTKDRGGRTVGTYFYRIVSGYRSN